MVSLQTESNYWFHYEPTYPPSDQYISVDRPNDPSYPSIMIYDSIGDDNVEKALLYYAPNSFTREYCSYTKRFSNTDTYTLFVPLSSPDMDIATDMIETKGFSTENKERREKGSVIREQLLRQAMCPYKILPYQIQGRETTIDCLLQPNTFYIDKYGTMNHTYTITKYIECSNATLFFYY